MAHFAKVVDGKVTEVIVAEQDHIDTLSGTWVQTSYNTRGGVHYQPNTHTPSEDQSKSLRGNYAGIGDIYDSVNDVFYKSQPYNSWTLNTTTWQWDPPTLKPDDTNIYKWNEETQNSTHLGILQPIKNDS